MKDYIEAWHTTRPKKNMLLHIMMTRKKMSDYVVCKLDEDVVLKTI